MHPSDIARAQRVLSARDSDAAMRSRLIGQSRIRLLIGGAGDEDEIVLAAPYLAALRDDIVAALNARIAEANETLKSMGVEV